MRIRVFGHVGHVLAEGPVQIGPFTIGHNPPIKVKEVLQPQLSADVAAVVALPPVKRFTTGTYFWLTVDAFSRDAAIAHVNAEELPVLATVLSRLEGRPIDLEAVWAYDDSGEGHGASGVASIIQLTPQPLDSATAESDYGDLYRDERIRGACRHRDRARQLQEASGNVGPAAADAAIVEYMKAVEYLVTDGRLPAVPMDNVDGQREDILKELQGMLASKKGLSKRASAVLGARDKLMRLENKFLNLKIESFAEVAALDRKWLNAAQALLTARNKKAAHPGSYLTNAEHARILFAAVDGDGARWELSSDWVAVTAIEHFRRLTLASP